MSFFEFVGPFVLVLGVLIFVHELGHFLAAKGFGVKVERFSLGFGPAIVQRTVGETEYRVAWIPFGGYVKMLGELPGEPLPEEELPRAFTSRPVYQRVVIAAAGPAMNFFLPLLLLGGAYIAGVPSATARVGSVITGSVAEASGLLPGDRILSVGGQPTEWWAEVSDEVEEAAGALILEVERRGEQRTLTLQAGSEVDRTALGLGMQPSAPAAVLAVRDERAPAALAGLRTGDRVVRVDGAEIQDWPAFVETLEGKSRSVDLEVARAVEGQEPETLRVTVEPVGPGVVQRLGILSGDLLVDQVEDGSPAEAGGLEVGDLVLAVNDRPIRGFRDLAAQIRSSGGAPVQLRVLRDGRPVGLEVLPEERTLVRAGIKEEAYAIGIRGGAPGASELRTRRIANPFTALAMGAEWSLDITVRTFQGIGMLLSGKVGREGLAGPIGIGVIAAQSFQAGWVPGLLIMAVISINLAILNLLPIPVLDGGQIVFALAEKAKGSPISFRTREIAQQVGVTLLLLVMVFAVWNDFTRHWPDIVGYFGGSP
ncbi:MAG: RIP metalloprotease RseP [Myxococcota bacterium]